jgi:hypothetical protein
MTLEENFKSKGQASYCMYLGVKKAILQGEISEMEKKIAPLRNKQGASNYTYTYNDSEKELLKSTNLKLTGLYDELQNYNVKMNEINCNYDKVNTCKFIDIQIKRKSDLVTQLSKGVLAGKSNPKDLKQLNLELLNQKNNYADYNCKNLIEYQRLAELGLIITEKSAEQEKKILGSGYKEQYAYIGIGAVALLVGLYIYMKK